MAITILLFLQSYAIKRDIVKVVGHIPYLGSNISSKASSLNLRIGRAWADIELSNNTELEFSQNVTQSVTKRKDKELGAN